jgi:hypothetical protein
LKRGDGGNTMGSIVKQSGILLKIGTLNAQTKTYHEALGIANIVGTKVKDLSSILDFSSHSGLEQLDFVRRNECGG